MATKVLQAAAGKRWRPAISTMLVAVLMTTMPPLIVVFWGRIGEQAMWIKRAVPGIREGPDDDVSFVESPRTSHDKLLGGLLVDGFDQESCHSRYQSAMYRRNAGRQPSEHLVSKLRSHEDLQRRCGPGTAAYSAALEQLKSGKSPAASPECRYLVSISYRGLGNRILAAASGFLYALLTGRVHLVDPSNQMDDLFCEPFTGTTWLLPPGFPLVDYQSFYLHTAQRYGKMRENRVLRPESPDAPVSGGQATAAVAVLPAFAYIHLDYNQTDYDQLFFCDEDQRLLSNIQWLVVRTDSYIVPGLFLVKAFQDELAELFPERDAVFHHLGRYLFHPTNHVWGLVTRYYRGHLAWARRRVGIQVRVSSWESESPELLKTITTCTQEEGLLPRSWYYEKMKGMYWEQATATGEVVVVDQPSHEEHQLYGVKAHDRKAWAEMYLLSLTDMIVTTGTSTFGYVAQGLGGLTPWVLPRGEVNGTAPPCRRDMSMEPCFHVAPLYDCKRWEDAGKIVPHVRHCDDMPAGLKLVDRTEW
ncbi:hypothetical protein E2562_002271 [Oryza meyeriana var. granulata]|uniref:Fucosyltransferase n=1 Tax=Oryza meyeriana var. granulata TaxID=110450 RepID=A0A6G1BI88_9ORYZ|nr:hypothetical protein E2562_002271 [Oryza meyeriana var. granulata]